MSKRTQVAALVGLLGGAAAIVGTVLPWLSLSVPGGSDPTSGGQASSINGVLVSSGFILAFAAGIAIAAGWLWAGTEPRKGAVVLGVLGFSVATHLQDPDARLRQDVVELLGVSGDPGALPLVEPLLKDREPQVARAAERAVARLRNR